MKNKNLKDIIIKRRKEFFVLLLGLISATSFLFPSTNHLEGRWYLYSDNHINSEIDLANASLNEYIIISDEEIKSFLSDSQNFISSYDIKGRKIYSGDSIFEYDITHIENKKILTLELVGFKTPNTMVESVEKAVYVFDENFELD